MKKFILCCFIVLLWAAPAFSAELPSAYWPLNEQYGAAINQKDRNGVIYYGNQIIDLISREPETEQTWNILASRLYAVGEAYEYIKDYKNAARCFSSYIPYGEACGWTDGVKIAQAKAAEFEPTIDLYTKTNQTQCYFGAKNEPEQGVLIGQTSETMQADESMVLLYLEYGDLNSINWANQVLVKAAQTGKAVELALNFPRQGSQLPEILTDEQYLPKLTGLLSHYSEIPVYLRIGAEVNIWDDRADPQQFIAAFQKITSSARTAGSHIATVYGVSFASSWDVDMDSYYPGDDYVDWVGVSAYANPMFGGTEWAPEDSFNEVVFMAGDSADPVRIVAEAVRRYGDRKPIMVSEGGVSHFVRTAQKDTTDWATVHLKRMYHYLPMVYPQIKLMAYFNRVMEAEINDYALSTNPSLAEAYQALSQLPPFIRKSANAKPEYTYQKLGFSTEVNNELDLFAYPHVHADPEPKIDYYLDGQWVAGSSSIPYEVSLDLSGYEPGEHGLKVVCTSAGTVQSEKSYSLWKSGEIRLQVNGKLIETDAAPFIENDRTLVPVRVISESLGAMVGWDDDLQRVTIQKDGKTVLLTINSPTMLVDREPVFLDVPPRISLGRTFVPVRAVADILGAKVDWDGQNRCVIIDL